MFRRFVGFLLLALVAVVIYLARGQEEQKGNVAAREAGEAAAWSAVVDGVQGRVTVERAKVVEGTQMLGVRLWLKNVRDVQGSVGFAWTKATLRFEVVDEAGKGLKQGPGIYDEVRAEAEDFVLPFKGELSFDVSHWGAGIEPGKYAELDLGSDQVWVIPREGVYYLKGTLEIPEGKRVGGREGWHGRLELPRVRILPAGS